MIDGDAVNVMVVERAGPQLSDNIVVGGMNLDKPTSFRYNNHANDDLLCHLSRGLL